MLLVVNCFFFALLTLKMKGGEAAFFFCAPLFWVGTKVDLRSDLEVLLSPIVEVRKAFSDATAVHISLSFS